MKFAWHGCFHIKQNRKENRFLMIFWKAIVSYFWNIFRRFRWNHFAAIYRDVIPRIHHYIYRAMARSFGYKNPHFHSRYSPLITWVYMGFPWLSARQLTNKCTCNTLQFQVHGVADSKIMPCDLTWPRMTSSSERFLKNMWQILWSDLCALHLLYRFDKQKHIVFF